MLRQFPNCNCNWIFVGTHFSDPIDQRHGLAIRLRNDARHPDFWIDADPRFFQGGEALNRSYVCEIMNDLIIRQSGSRFVLGG